MRKHNTQPLSDVVQQYLKSLGLDKKLKEVKLINYWETLIGKTIAKATTDIYIANGIMYISLQSSVIRKELSMIKTEHNKRMNEHE